MVEVFDWALVLCDSCGFELETLLLPYVMIATISFAESMTLETS